MKELAGSFSRVMNESQTEEAAEKRCENKEEAS